MNAVRFNSSAQHVPPATARFSGQVPVHFEGMPQGPFEGDGRWVGVKSFDHAALCRAFGLDPARFWFDLPSTVRGVGPNMAGAGRVNGGRRTIEGYVFMTGRDRPVAALYVCTDGDRLRDVDPLSVSDAEAFGYRR